MANRTFGKIAVAGGLGLVGLYVGISVWDALGEVAAGITSAGEQIYDGIVFKDTNALWAYRQLIKADKYYPWLTWVSGDIATVFICWLGLAGGSVQFFWEWLQEGSTTPAKRRLTFSDAAKIPLRGLIGGLIVILTVVAIPRALDVSGPNGLAGLAFFAGMFSDSAYARVKSIWEGKLKAQPPQAAVPDTNEKE